MNSIIVSQGNGNIVLSMEFLKSGHNIKRDLHKRIPTIEEEISRIHIVWNSTITLSSRQMIGSQPNLAWKK
jgi:hypothetical protein